MAVEAVAGGMTPVMAFALIGALGVGSQWLAWRLRMPAIVLMLVAGVLIGPVTGVLDPSRDIGVLMSPMISIAVAIILFEGGLSLNFHTLKDRATGVRRLVLIGAPLGWITSTLAIHYGAGLAWQPAAVFGGIMIVTGPTVIAPLLRQARLAKRPAALLQWEAIINDPIGALAAVFAFEYVVVRNTAFDAGTAMIELAVGIIVACVSGLAAGIGLSKAFKAARVPEYMKVPVLFATLLACFAVSDSVLHESGLLAVTIMGIVMANAELPSYTELRRFKEHATILLVSGVFILLAANLDVEALKALDWRAAVFVALVVLVARPVTVFVSLLGSGVPWREQVLVAFTGPRGVVLVAVAGLFGERLTELGIPGGELIGPLAFVLVSVTVVLHGFTLAPVASFLGLTGGDRPGVIVVGGSRWGVRFAEALQKAEVPVLIADPNHGYLRGARSAGFATFSGDLLSEAAEDRIELVSYATIVAATDNDAYNTLVATDLAPEFGRDNVFQVSRSRSDSARHSLPATLGGKGFSEDETFNELDRMIAEGWVFRTTRLTEEYTLDDWRKARTGARVFARVSSAGEVKLVGEDSTLKGGVDVRLVSMIPPELAKEIAGADAAKRANQSESG